LYAQCGSLSNSAPIGSLVVPYDSFGVTRNYDYFFSDGTQQAQTMPYHITRALPCDKQVHDALVDSLQKTLPQGDDKLSMQVFGNIVNASADSFYSSQGRQTTLFEDENENLIAEVRKRHPKVQTLEMETFLLNHLAMSANASQACKNENGSSGRIRTGAAQMV
jgi:uridine phosphorylase